MKGRQEIFHLLEDELDILQTEGAVKFQRSGT
jgi:hypothetical protein